MSEITETIAVLGGTGDLGGGLAYRWALAGLNVIIGSRDAARAEAAAADLCQRVPTASVHGMDNLSAAKEADIVVLSVPFAHQRRTLEEIRAGIQGKLLIDTSVCLQPPKVGRVQLPPEGSAGQIAQQLLGDDVAVVSAFQNIAAAHLNSDHEIHCDVLVCGNKREARQQVINLAAAAGLRAWHAGPIDNAAAVEGLTSVLITINRLYKIPGSGIVITGQPQVEETL